MATNQNKQAPASSPQTQTQSQSTNQKRDLSEVVEALKDYNNSNEKQQTETRNELKRVLSDAIENMTKGDMKARDKSLKELKLMRGELKQFSSAMGEQGEEFTQLYDKVIDAAEKGNNSLQIMGEDIKKQLKLEQLTSSSLIKTIVESQNPIIKMGYNLVSGIVAYRKSVKDRIKAQQDKQESELEKLGRLQTEAVSDAADQTVTAVKDTATDIQDAVKETTAAVKESSNPKTKGPMVMAMEAIRDSNEAQINVLNKMLKVLEVASPSGSVEIKNAVVDLDEAVIALYDINDTLDVIVKQLATQSGYMAKQIDIANDTRMEANKRALDAMDDNRGSHIKMSSTPNSATPEPTESGGAAALLAAFASNMLGEIAGHLFAKLPIGKMIKGILGGALKLVKAPFKLALLGASGIGAMMKPDFWTGIFGKSMDFIGSIVDFFKKIDFSAIIKTVTEFTKGGFWKIIDTFNAGMRFLFTNVFKIFSMGEKAIEGLLKIVPGKILGKLFGWITTIYSFFSGFMDAANILDKNEADVTLWDRVSAGLATVVSDLLGIVDWILGLFGLDWDISGKAQKYLAQALSKLPDMLMGWVTSVFDNYKKAYDNIASAFNDGFLNGLKTMVVEFLKNVTGWNLLPESVQNTISDGVSSLFGTDSGATPAKTEQPAFNQKAADNKKAIDQMEQSKKSQPASNTVVADNRVNNNTTVVQSAPIYSQNPDQSHKQGLGYRATGML